MPYFKLDNNNIWFSHVPKCGGTSIEKTLVNHGVSLSFYDPSFFSVSKKSRWNNSSPQHIQINDALRCLNFSQFHYKFVVVRDPVKRFISAFNHKKNIGHIKPWETVSSFLSKLEKNDSSEFHFRFDNHFIEANKLTHDECMVFYLEDGFDKLGLWFNKILGRDIPLNFGHMNSGHTRAPTNNISRRFKIYKNVDLQSIKQKDISRIKEYYFEDYKRFW